MGIGPSQPVSQWGKKAVKGNKKQKSKIKKPNFVGVFGNQNPNVSQWGKKANTNKPRVTTSPSGAKPALVDAARLAPQASGIQAQQPVVQVDEAKQTAAFNAAQVAMQDKFKQQNPNAPKMPAGIGFEGAPANMPQPIPGSGVAGPQRPMGGGRRGKGGQSPTGSKGGQTRNPYVGGGGGMTPGTGFNDGPKGPRPQSGPQPRPNMSRGAKGGQHPSGKGGRRPSPSMGRPNPYAAASTPNTLESRMAAGTGMQAPNVSAQPMAQGNSDLGVDPNLAAPMMKKAPAFKLRSPHSTTFKEMGSDNKKSAPTRKTSTGYKMPGFGKR